MTLDMKKFAGSAFIKLESVGDGVLIKTIIDVTEGQFGRPVLTFADGSRLTLNKTNVGALLTFGDSSKDWLGKRIEIFAGVVSYNGSDTDSVRVRAHASPASKKKKEGGDPEDELDREIPF